MGVPEEEKDVEKIFEEIMAENFANWMNINIQEAQGTPSMRKSKRTIPRHIITNYHRIFKSQRILKAARGKQITTKKGSPIRFSADFPEILEARRQQANIFKALKGKKRKNSTMNPTSGKSVL